ncbi:DUF4184 family protein [Streptomyces xanthii]|uniref:DUF4184 family protein n=1 Tax=Streptomyces xanthii TaxID=2768069 RepID=A0A7H1BDP0_9ACTN|nr:DUF4184 family protein [Streptomyces xanthii]QNS06845.1 DUF4184 family protein [Streptomyces xanthii]
MPFTLSHAAAVLPLIRRDGSGRGPFVPSLLVAGSFAPDVTYFAASAVPGAMRFGEVTHSFPGVFTVDVPIALALVGLWRLVAGPLTGLLPARVRGRVRALAGNGPRWPASGRGPTLLRWYASAVLGALTHVVWDAFTHLDRWGMRILPVLGEKIAGSPLYWYAQYGGSALALGVIGLFLWRALRGAGPGAVPDDASRAAGRGQALVLIGGCAGLGAVLRVARWLAYVDESGLEWKPWEIIPTLCFGAGAGLVVGAVLFAAGQRFQQHRHSPVPTPPEARPDPLKTDSHD